MNDIQFHQNRIVIRAVTANIRAYGLLEDEGPQSVKRCATCAAPGKGPGLFEAYRLDYSPITTQPYHSWICAACLDAYAGAGANALLRAFNEIAAHLEPCTDAQLDVLDRAANAWLLCAHYCAPSPATLANPEYQRLRALISPNIEREAKS